MSHIGCSENIRTYEIVLEVYTKKSQGITEKGTPTTFKKNYSCDQKKMRGPKRWQE
jgi:hypothetical protein